MTMMTKPKTRADCIDGPRPCLYFTCRHNLTLDPESPIEVDADDLPLRLPLLSPVLGGNVIRLPILLPDQPSNCALDYQGQDMTDAEVAAVMGLTESEVIKIQASAHAKLGHYKIADPLLEAWEDLRAMRRGLALACASLA